MGYVDSLGNYYDGDRQGEDLEVSQRPGLEYKWSNGTWVKDKSFLISKLNDEYSPQFQDLQIKICIAATVFNDTQCAQELQEYLGELQSEYNEKRSAILNE